MLRTARFVFLFGVLRSHVLARTGVHADAVAFVYKQRNVERVAVSSVCGFSRARRGVAASRRVRSA
jgi:hypothetical protein